MLAWLLLGGLGSTAWAADPPSTVGRVSELNGKVWVYAPESSEWITASRNRPVTSGDRLSTEADGRAEIRVGTSVLRLAASSELEVIQLDEQHVDLQLHSGSLAVRLRTREAVDQFSLMTNEGRFHAERTGSYRFDRIDDTSHATVWGGQAQFEGEGAALTLQSGQRAEFWKDSRAPNTQYSITDPKRDAFSDWVASLDQREERSVSTRYVSPEMTGVEDLDRYGRWEQTPDYGPVWTPRAVDPGWAPYRMGHWAWVGPWGWTWVDDAPWGFAPFHYGRWVYRRDNWCWSPGTYVARPVYAPALVAWVGGPRANVSISIGNSPNVGWFPLGPREVYVPGYSVSPAYVRNVNVTHVTNITNVTNIINNPTRVVEETHYVNRGIPRAVTVVPSSVMERRQPVAPAMGSINDRIVHDVSRERPRFDAPVAAPGHATRFVPGERLNNERGNARGPIGQAPGERPPQIGIPRGGREGNGVGSMQPVPAAPRSDEGRTNPLLGGNVLAPSRGGPIERPERPERSFDRREREGAAAPVNGAQVPPLPTVRVAPSPSQSPPAGGRFGDRERERESGRQSPPIVSPDGERIGPTPGQRAIVREGRSPAFESSGQQPQPGTGRPQVIAPRNAEPVNPGFEGRREQESPRMRHQEMPARNVPPQVQMPTPPQVQQPAQVPMPQRPQFQPRPIPEMQRPPVVQAPREVPRIEIPRDGAREGAARENAARENAARENGEGRQRGGRENAR